jgi:hypothetical protein
MTALARASSNCKQQTRPLVRENAPHQQTHNCQTVRKSGHKPQMDLYIEYMHNYRQRRAQEIKAAQVGNSHAAYVREYRKRKQLEEDNCNNVPK